MGSIKQLEADFYASDAHKRAASLEEMASLAAVDFTARRGEFGPEAAEVLSWCYTYDFK